MILRHRQIHQERNKMNMQEIETLRSSVAKVFDRILIINLPFRSDRRVEIEGELNRIGLSLKDGSAEILSASRFKDAGSFASIGARGCFDSHVRALKAAYERNSNGVLILEDDCDFIDDIRHKLPGVLHNLSVTQWSIFYGGHHSGAAPLNDLRGISMIAANESLSATHFIAVSGRALPALIPYLEAMAAREPGSPLGGPMHIDGAYSWFRKDNPEFETWVAEPQLGFQRPSRTDIHQLRFYDRLVGLREAIDAIRRVKRKLRK